MAVLGYWEMPEEDQPPEEYWGNDAALKEWFDAVKARHAERYGTSGGDEGLEVVPQTENEYAKELLSG